MSQQKLSQSGLRTVTRDFSSKTHTKDEPISWPKSKDQRLKDIQAGIDQRSIADVQKSNGDGITAHTANSIKRSLQVALEEPPAKKKRQLPPSFQNCAPTKSPYFTRPSVASEPKAPSQSQTDSIAFSANVVSNTASSKPKVVLSQEQTQILQLVEEGKSLFYTGSAGTGKSVLLREIIKSLRKRYNKSPDAIAITASTGMYALHATIVPLIHLQYRYCSM
ncbi:hypothetical protein EDD16DRAFT_1499868 [Pisolithus croceorrhizus]|nr:hypothetical protein EDD16DRAFT_1499868 [Pisolithus croceorrhizus]KAI6126422.1 hypothetical protein EV401DRAFT_1854592 [Pisolithus croceorrhizus]